MNTDTPTIVTLCGSMRFFEQMLQVASDETAKGHIVLAPFSVVAPEDQGDDFKAMLDRLHFQKIDLSEQVIVVTNQDGYIGQSTEREMVYALHRGKALDVREVDSAPAVIVDGQRMVGNGHAVPDEGAA
jgi:hypothetical protein